ncbi:hypothetical protein [Streptomyces sp. T028]
MSCGLGDIEDAIVVTLVPFVNASWGALFPLPSTTGNGSTR